MASTQQWDEWNGAGQTLTANVTNMNWKNIDDATSAYTAQPITAGNNSFTKYQAVKFGGTYNTLSSASYKIDVNSEQSGAVTIKGAVVSTYTTPSTTASGDALMSTTGLAASFGTGASAFSTAGGTSTSTNPIYLQALRTQLQTTGAAAPGDITAKTITCTWTES